MTDKSSEKEFQEGWEAKGQKNQEEDQETEEDEVNEGPMELETEVGRKEE